MSSVLRARNERQWPTRVKLSRAIAKTTKIASKTSRRAGRRLIAMNRLRKRYGVGFTATKRMTT